MRLSKALNEKVMDVRLRDKLVAEGKISQAQVDEYFKSLQDESSNLRYSSRSIDSKSEQNQDFQN
ncbi:MAG: hypothetical protein A2381_16805 [Bdellovibrionales bacterium RIFOXYB1_FULL_37_110]|nr:MAG: hypothetical protein A2181_07810 [Bdellovibrionales bacterium RIFOXYA1_FULL_38_20]OFZ50058.1 MAG: hypothetical protein A2417_18640 [Bdellovibrionales bacterium RIFOXYC1_FULL_37_79]OFZ59114.1 MAG: hypothetical protein A2328_04510 [Bdellovibrionales bacterium RIFOXYB2_FULL_36_6]OFZ59964.1 MAG: hypothetical protein A2381_16805 [Bdellovibrionales bacterium RIFOXYB1_FULL_37_110]OFZ63935.1 MAG: hypothetical protein A2577_05995 [Bdellovibrionales bacterium RIFOXYD1_FULL_36_51]